MKRAGISWVLAGAFLFAGVNANADDLLSIANPPATAQKPPSSKGGGPKQQHVQIAAQEAAAKAPDTASADAAKKRVLAEAARSDKAGSH